MKLDGVGRSKPPVKSCYLKVKIRSVCIPWAHTSWEIAQGILSCTWSQLGLAILSRRSINWVHLYVDILGLTRSTYIVSLVLLLYYCHIKSYCRCHLLGTCCMPGNWCLLCLQRSIFLILTPPNFLKMALQSQKWSLIWLHWQYVRYKKLSQHQSNVNSIATLPWYWKFTH